MCSYVSFLVSAKVFNNIFKYIMYNMITYFSLQSVNTNKESIVIALYRSYRITSSCSPFTKVLITKSVNMKVRMEIQ